jgi:hypothetical protein
MVTASGLFCLAIIPIRFIVNLFLHSLEAAAIPSDLVNPFQYDF